MAKQTGIPIPEDLNVSEVMLQSELGMHVFSLEAIGPEGLLKVEAETGKKLGSVALSGVELYVARAYFVGIDEPRTITEFVSLYKALPGRPVATTNELKDATQHLADIEEVPLLGHNLVRKGASSTQVTWLSSDTVSRGSESVLALALYDRYVATGHDSAKELYDNFVRTGEISAVPTARKLPSPAKKSPEPEKPESLTSELQSGRLTPLTNKKDGQPDELMARIHQQREYPAQELERQLGGLKPGEWITYDRFVKGIQYEGFSNLVERELYKWEREGRVVRGRIGKDRVLQIPKTNKR